MKIDPAIVAVTVMICFVLFAVFSVIKIDATNKLRYQQEIEYYKAKADSALQIADSANTLTTQCIERLETNGMVQQWVK